jgi:RNA polymerase sigma factor (sigma-70 family)
MASTQLAGVLRHLHQIVGPPDSAELSDAQLLQCFLAERDETAFRLLVERHGRMVLGVCRYVLRQRQDAEDAFQATFLILAQSAASIRKGAALASWLYGVAYRTALNARTRMMKRRQHERRVGKVAHTAPDLDLAWQELQAVLAEEVNRLAEKYRAPFVLCCLDGLSKSEAARRLGWKEGTVSGRLAEARKRLQQRLSRRGLTLAAALCAGAWSAGARAGVPSVLIRTTLQAALGVASGQTTASVAPAPVAALVEGAKQTMFLGKVKLVGVLLLVAGLAAGGVGVHIHRALAAPPAAEQPAASAARKAEKPAADKAPTKKDGEITVSGRVLDPDGKPVAGARLWMPNALWGDAEKGSVVEQKSDKDGRFHFSIDPLKLVRGRSLIATADGYGPDGIDVRDTEKLGQSEITLRLARDLPIAGRVLDLEGRPIKDVSVSVRYIEIPVEHDLTPVLKSIHRDGNRVFHHPMRYVSVGSHSGIVAPVKTDAQGRFRITGVGAERVVELWIEGPTIEHRVAYVLTRPGINVKELIQSAPERPGPDGKGRPMPDIYGPTFDHLAGPTKPIVGTIRDKATGKPVAGAFVNGSAGGWWGNYVLTKTDKDGRYRIIGVAKAPKLRIRAGAPEQDYLPGGKAIGDSEGLDPITLDLELTRGVRVRGRITDKTTGKPVPAALWYFPLADNKYFATLPGKEEANFEGMGHRNEKDGTYSLLALPGPGLIKVRAEVEGDNPYTQVVLDPADRPRAYSTKDEGLGQSFLSARGIIETLLDHNAYRVIDPAPDAGSITCDMQFDRGVSRTGKVVGPDGKALTNVRAGGLLPLGGNKTLSDGSFQAVGLNPAQPRPLFFMHKERKLVGHVLLAADAKEPVTVRLQPGAVVTGRLLDEDGKPLAGVTVATSYRVNEARWLAEDATGKNPLKTDTDGRFRIECIFPGLEFGFGFVKGRNFLDPGEKYRRLILKAETRDLGDIVAKPYRPG